MFKEMLDGEAKVINTDYIVENLAYHVEDILT